MVAKCANPHCNCEFRELNKGRLFLLPPVDDSTDWRVPKLIDHCYWLCPSCAITHTITLDENRPVVRQQQSSGGSSQGALGSAAPVAGAGPAPRLL